MTQHIEYLLCCYKIPNEENLIRKNLVTGNTSLILSTISETECVSYLKQIEPSFFAETIENPNMTLIELDNKIRMYSLKKWNDFLLSLYKFHYSPIWRIAGFFTNYIINLNELYKKEKE
jgi:hypothetical protein